MDAVKFIKERNRMCDSFLNCHGCPLEKTEDCLDNGIGCIVGDEIKQIVEIVEKWSAEHPQKTILQDLLEKYPNTRLNSRKLPFFCVVDLGYKGLEGSLCGETDCAMCWNQPLEN